jgi:hypothetical protein
MANRTATTRLLSLSGYSGVTGQLRSRSLHCLSTPSLNNVRRVVHPSQFVFGKIIFRRGSDSITVRIIL